MRQIYDPMRILESGIKGALSYVPGIERGPSAYGRDLEKARQKRLSRYTGRLALVGDFSSNRSGARVVDTLLEQGVIGKDGVIGLRALVHLEAAGPHFRFTQTLRHLQSAIEARVASAEVKLHLMPAETPVAPKDPLRSAFQGLSKAIVDFESGTDLGAKDDLVYNPDSSLIVVTSPFLAAKILKPMIGYEDLDNGGVVVLSHVGDQTKDNQFQALSLN